MQKIVIQENAEIEVNDELASLIEAMLQEEPDLPLHLTQKTLSFNDYTVGSIQIGYYSIEIKPRNPIFNLEALFEMLLFESMNNFEESYSSTGFGDNQSFGAISISSQFFYECSRLIDFGITGGFVRSELQGKDIAGSIVMEKFHPKYIPLHGVTFRNDNYTYDVPANQIIKSAIKKVMRSGLQRNIKNDFQFLLKKFDNIEDYSDSIDSIEDITKSFYSANPHYPLVLEFAIKILKEMKLKFSNGNLRWYAFLHNSNDIFEKYVRKVLSKGLKSHVTKWESPKKVAVLDDGLRTGKKSYSPDILIDFDSSKNTAKAVIDVKNKKFETSNSDIGEILNSADMYQLTFYCDKMKTHLGALIYPAGSDFSPVNVMIDGNQNFRFVIFTINLKERIGLRHKKLCKAITENLLYYMN